MLSAMYDPSLIEPADLRPISRREYDRMVEAGIFHEDEHVELLEGMLVKMSPHGAPHAKIVEWLNNRLVRAIDESLSVRPQLPFAASDWSEPEPDLAIVRTEFSNLDHPSEVLLLIEVSDSTLRYDRKIKVSIYARAGVPEYWIVNVTNMTVEVYTDPQPSGYASKQVLRDGDVLRPTKLPGVEIAVSALPGER